MFPVEDCNVQLSAWRSLVHVYVLHVHHHHYHLQYAWNAWSESKLVSSQARSFVDKSERSLRCKLFSVQGVVFGVIFVNEGFSVSLFSTNIHVNREIEKVFSMKNLP